MCLFDDFWHSLNSIDPILTNQIVLETLGHVLTEPSTQNNFCANLELF